MSKSSQNIVIMMELETDPWDIDFKVGNMCLNRFCIEENTAFELSGVYYLKKWFDGKAAIREKGKG